MDNGLRKTGPTGSKMAQLQRFMGFFSFNLVSDEGGSNVCNSEDSDGPECQDPGETELEGPLGRERGERTVRDVSSRAAHNRTRQSP